MSVSSVSSPTPVVPISTGTAPQPSTQSSTDNNSDYQPPPKPPLPPGQGTQVDQLA